MADSRTEEHGKDSRPTCHREEVPVFDGMLIRLTKQLVCGGVSSEPGKIRLALAAVVDRRG
jgi:hypothetical protein